MSVFRYFRYLFISLSPLVPYGVFRYYVPIDAASTRRGYDDDEFRSNDRRDSDEESGIPRESPWEVFLMGGVLMWWECVSERGGTWFGDSFSCDRQTWSCSVRKVSVLNKTNLIDCRQWMHTGPDCIQRGLLNQSKKRQMRFNNNALRLTQTCNTFSLLKTNTFTQNRHIVAVVTCLWGKLSALHSRFLLGWKCMLYRYVGWDAAYSGVVRLLLIAPYSVEPSLSLASFQMQTCVHPSEFTSVKPQILKNMSVTLIFCVIIQQPWHFPPSNDHPPTQLPLPPFQNNTRSLHISVISRKESV